MTSVPQPLERGVAEAQHDDVLHRLLPKVVVDAEDARLVEHRVQALGELARRSERVAEGLLDDDAAALGRLSGGADALGDRGEVLGRRREVVEASGVASLGVEPVERPSEALEPVALVERAAHMDQRPREPTPGLLVDRAARAARWPRVPASGDLVAHVRARVPHHRVPLGSSPSWPAGRAPAGSCGATGRRSRRRCTIACAPGRSSATVALPSTQTPVPADQRVRRGVVLELPHSPRRELGRDAAGEGLAELDTHWSNGSTSQIAACTKTLCSYSAMSWPSADGELAREDVVGRLPGNVRWGTCSGGTPSASTSAAVRPKARASA